MIALEPRLFHWFVIPVAACGVWALQETRRWVSGRIDLFDPKAIMAVAGVHFFFLSPLLFVLHDGQMNYVVNPPDWRPWLGWMAVLNLIGIVCFEWASRVAYDRRTRPRMLPEVKPARLLHLFAAGVDCAAVANVVVFSRVGGVAGIIAEKMQSTGVFAGLGSARIFSESLPLFALFVLTALRRPSYGASRTTIYTLLLLVAAAQFAVAGFLGSRAAVVWPLFWAVGVIHYFWRRLMWRDMAMLGIAVLAFSYTYAFYKSLGGDVMGWLDSGASMGELERQTGRDLDMLLIGDLSRTDVQAFVLYRLSDPERDYALYLGKTYLWDWTPLFPAWLWGDKPESAGKAAAGTDIQVGRGAFGAGIVRASSRVYGLAGEAMLNFGPMAVPPAFALCGWLVGRWRRFRERIAPGDIRLALAPLLCSTVLLVLYMDLDNVLAHVILRSGGPLAFILIGVARQRRTVRTSGRFARRALREAPAQ
jgi:hypothetical protein